MKEQSNELEGHQGAGLPQPQCSSARPALGSHPPPSTATIQASTTPFSGPIKGRLMKHGERITLTLTGRCPILCLATINNMAASCTFALEKEVHSESHVLTTFFLVLLLFQGQICCLFVWFCFLLANCLWVFWRFWSAANWRQLYVEQLLWVLLLRKSTLCEAKRWLTVALCATCGLKLWGSIIWAVFNF